METKEETKKYLAEKLEQYVRIILKEYGDVIKTKDIIRLKKIKDYKDYIKIENTGTITCYVNNTNHKIYFPESVSKILKTIKLIPSSSIDKNHKAYTKENLITNDNTFDTYIKHIFLKGLNTKEFYEENLLHESLHFCGSKGADPLKEGLTENRTRKLAQKYNIITTGCGYPKEVEIVNELDSIFGEKFLNMYLFDDGYKCWEYLGKHFGTEAQEIFKKVEHSMNDEFHDKYYKKTFSFKGMLAPIKKSKTYKHIDYQKTHEIIDEYKKQKALEKKTSEKKPEQKPETKSKTSINKKNQTMSQKTIKNNPNEKKIFVVKNIKRPEKPLENKKSKARTRSIYQNNSRGTTNSLNLILIIRILLFLLLISMIIIIIN